ncbi:zinc finger protein [Saccharopolyspora rosea]|uniref:Zinc finger protein n=1 Tax=Saccharopolyspora rosea TaxID=524884 RepID=A0ABW3FK98_9PSEU|nr:zinc finger protein [Saccharopolyspora rosea]
MPYSPHPFHWVPAGGARHASADEKHAVGNYPTGTAVTTLCGDGVIAENTAVAWLWPTCATCNAEAHRLAGAQMSSARTRREFGKDGR